MANSNGNLVKALGVAGLVIGLVGGSFGVAATIGPAQRVSAAETKIIRLESTRDEFIDFRGSMASDIATIKAAILEIKGKLP